MQLSVSLHGIKFLRLSRLPLVRVEKHWESDLVTAMHTAKPPIILCRIATVSERPKAEAYLAALRAGRIVKVDRLAIKIVSLVLWFALRVMQQLHAIDDHDILLHLVDLNCLVT